MRNDPEVGFAIAIRQMEHCILELRAALNKRSILLKEYNPNQPRIPARQTGGGRWTSGGAADFSPQPRTENIPPVSLFVVAATQEECDEQYRRDLIVCKFTGLRTCYAQAMVRLVACERGHPIPPLNF